MGKKLCVYTCITGNYDNLNEVEVIEDSVDYLCFTNNKNLKSKTWKIVYIDNDGLNNQHLSRKIKMLGHPIIADNYDISVWMDASVIWKKKISNFVSDYLKDAPFAAFKHSERKKVSDEAKACLRYHKDSKEKITQTIQFLESEKFPDNLGLYEMTVFIKKHNDPHVIKAMSLWFEMVQKYSKRDQLSFMYVIWKTRLRINPINLSVWHNSWFYTVPHIKNSTISKCYFYFGDPNKDYSFNKSFSYTYEHCNNNYSITSNMPIDTKLIEIEPIDSANILFKNVTFKTSSMSSITSLYSITNNGKKIFWLENDVLRIQGNFKKGQKFTFTFSTYPVNLTELFQIIQQLNNSLNQMNSTNLELSNEISNLRQINTKLTTDLQSILNSKSWKTINQIRKAFPPYKPTRNKIDLTKNMTPQEKKEYLYKKYKIK